MNIVEQDKDRNEKVNYDARLNFYRVIEKYLESIAQASLLNQTTLEFYLTRDIFAMLSPYISEKKTEELLRLIEQVQVSIALSQDTNSKRNTYNGTSIRECLFKLKLKLFQYTKNIWLPTQTDEDDEYSFEKIMEGNE